MSDNFASLIDTSNAFFTELAQNNTKDWFTPRKDQYTADIRKPAELLADLLAQEFTRMTGKPHGSKVFRIHRDVRFSKDKTPYNTHLHLIWSQTGRESAPAWFFGSAPDYLILGCGLMTMEKNALARFRAAVDADGAALSAALDTAARDAGASLSDYGPPPLKRVPKPYDPDHPQAELLKRKGIAVSAPLPQGWRSDGLIKSTLAAAEQLRPVWHWLDGVFA